MSVTRGHDPGMLARPTGQGRSGGRGRATAAAGASQTVHFAAVGAFRRPPLAGALSPPPEDAPPELTPAELAAPPPSVTPVDDAAPAFFAPPPLDDFLPPRDADFLPTLRLMAAIPAATPAAAAAAAAAPSASFFLGRLFFFPEEGLAPDLPADLPAEAAAPLAVFLPLGFADDLPLDPFLVDPVLPVAMSAPFGKV